MKIKITILFKSKKEMPYDTWGLYFPCKREIHVLKTLGKKNFARTLLHEIVHALIHIKHKSKPGPKSEEKICDIMELLADKVLDHSLAIVLNKETSLGRKFHSQGWELYFRC